jgi:hypothetical protein
MLPHSVHFYIYISSGQLSGNRSGSDGAYKKQLTGQYNITSASLGNGPSYTDGGLESGFKKKRVAMV